MSDGLSFATVVDTSGFEDGIKRIEDGIRSAASNVEGQSERIMSILNQTPRIDIEFITNAPTTEQQIKEAYAEIDATVALNQQYIAELTQEYNRLTGEINKFQNIPQRRDDVKQWREEKTAISENISLRKEIIAKVQDLTKVVEQNEKAFEKERNTQTSVKAQMRAVMAEMANLRNEAQKNGVTLDESTGRYRELAEELGRLKDIQGDVSTQAKILSNDEGQFQGILSGLTGLSGGFSAAQGAMALFGSENENLQKVMTQLQAVMAITIGLQQVQQMLNKDSAFRLVTLNSLRSLWNKLMGESNTAQATENAQKATDITLTESQTIAEEQNTIAEETNIAAREANNKATEAGVAGTVADTTATQAATASQNAHTGALTAGTLATKGLAVATKLLKAALISTGIGALIVAVGELVAWVGELINKEDDAVKHTKDLNKIQEDAAKTYIQEKVALEDNIKACQNFNGTKEQEKKKVDELNSKYGESLGYYDSLEEWENVLMERGPAYCEMLQMKAEQQGLLNRYVEAYVSALEVAHKAENGEFDSWWTGKFTPSSWFDDDKKKELVDARRKKITDAADAETEYWKKEMDKQKAKLEEYQKQNGFDVIHVDPNKKTVSGNGGKSGSTFDPKEAARKQKEALEEYTETVKQFIKETNKEIEQANIDAMADGLQKELKTINQRTLDTAEQWKQHFLQLAQKRQEYEKAYYLSQKGNTEEGWEASEGGKMTVQDYLNKMLADPENAEMAKQYYDRLDQITRQGEQQILNLKQSYQDKWIEQYGTDTQKEELLLRQWTAKLNQVMAEAPELAPQVLDAMEKAFDELDIERFKKSINWEEVFGNMDALATSSLKSLKDKLQKTLKSIDSPEAAKTITDAIKNIDEELAERNPFTNLKDSLINLISANGEVKAAQDAYNTALATGNKLEIEAARNTLDTAKNAKQKALAEATTAIQDSISKVKDYFGIVTTLTSTLEGLGVEMSEQLSGFMDGMGQVLDGLSQINLTNPVSIITGGISAIGGLIKGIGSLFNNDSKHQKNIEKLQTSIDALQKSYDKLADSVDDYYSKDASKMIEQQNTLLKQQKLLIEQQIKEEQSKKHTDSDKIKEWQEQIEEINELIEENKQSAIDAIFGEDLKSAIENFADAYAEAWASNEDRAKSAKDTVKTMMKQMVQESIKAAIQSSGKMEEIRQKLQEFYADNVLSGWEQDYIYKMAESLQSELDSQFGWADSLFSSDDEREGTSKGIATASQESVDENNARLTTIQGHTYTLVQLMQEHNTTTNAILEKVTGIEQNTSETNDKLEELDKKTKRVADTLDTIQTSGLKLK